MSDTATLNSRLRVLVAKAYRAEKLYASMRSTKSGKLVAEIANDIRSKEWQQSHSKLRTILNEILSEKRNSMLAAQISGVQKLFADEARASSSAMARNKAKLKDANEREEFSNCLKLNMELIRDKSRSQACKVIADELAALLETAAKNKKIQQIPFVKRAQETSDQAANVIPLRRANQK